MGKPGLSDVFLYVLPTWIGKHRPSRPEAFACAEAVPAGLYGVA